MGGSFAVAGAGGFPGAGGENALGGGANFGGAGGSGAGSGGTAGSVAVGGSGGISSQQLQDLKKSVVDLHFGLFLHFGILTYTGSWAQGNLPINQFNPTKLDVSQWAAAAKAAGAKFGVLTTRHHDGFALWPSKASAFNVGQVTWRNGQGDVVKEYVDAFRAAGLGPGFYYSIWDATQNNGSNPTPAQISYIKTQLTELLSNYGKIPILVFDGWSWMMGHQKVAYAEIHDLVKGLQPEIMISDHNGLTSPYDEDLVMYEEPKGAFAPANNQWAALQGNKINGSGGNDWFWAPDIGNLLSVSSIVKDHLTALSQRHTTFLLNCPPNRDGLFDQAIVDRLVEVGKAWTPPTGLPALPDQGIQNNHPLSMQSASATSGVAANAIDGVNDYGSHTMWQASGGVPQSITIDLGSVQPNVGYLGYLPPYSGNAPSANGNITSYTIEVSTDGTTFTSATKGTWATDGQLHGATFGPVAARVVRLTATGVSNGSPAATEITIGEQP
jgi:alpha-L-fucosidase